MTTYIKEACIQKTVLNERVFQTLQKRKKRDIYPNWDISHLISILHKLFV